MSKPEDRRVAYGVHNHLLALEATARLGSFRAAAEELHVTQGAVAQQVRSMESKLGMKLFDRLPRGLAPTEAARDYVNRIQLALRMIEDATRQLLADQHEKESHHLTISTTATFASRWLIPRLPALGLVHPYISVRIDASEVIRPLVGRDRVDMAIRWGTHPFREGDARFLLPGRAIPVCSPGLKGLGTWHRPEDLAQAPLISDIYDNWKRWFETYGHPEMHFSGPMFSQTSLALDAAEQGMGIALIPELFIQTSLLNGRLVRALASPFQLDTGYGFYVITGEGSDCSAVLDTVIQWLMAEAGEQLAD